MAIKLKKANEMSEDKKFLSKKKNKKDPNVIMKVIFSRELKGMNS